jgi:hypothetical protein
VKDNLGKILKIVAIVFMGLTAAMNILGGIGTVCAAFLTKQYPPMWALLDYQWLYQIVMIVTIALGLGGVWATIKLIKGGETAYRDAVILLAAGTVVGAVQVVASLALRGKAVPANVKLYINALTLILFLLLRLPGVRELVSFTKEDDQNVQTLASGLAAILTGTLVLSTTIWVGGSHVHEGFNWVQVLREPLLGSSAVLLGMGVLNFLRLAIRKRGRQLFSLGENRTV